MSEQRQERKREEAASSGPSEGKWARKALYALLIVAAFGGAYYLGNRNQHKYDGFARCLKDRGLVMYGAYWCPHCQEQKKMFAASFEYVPYIECGVQGDTRGVQQVCKDAGIKHFPTWQFPPTGERAERVFELDALSDRSGCPLP